MAASYVYSEPLHVHMISHGRYAVLRGEFMVPPNIELWQYSQPGQILSLVEAHHIYNSGGKEAEDLYLIKRDDGEIYASSFKLERISPGSKTKDLELTFTVDEFPGFKMGISASDGSVEIPTKANTIHLSELLSHLSSILPQDRVTKVIQLSCRSGTYIEYVPDVNEMRRAIEKCSTKKDYNSLLAFGYRLDVAFDNTSFFRTSSDKIAEQISCLIKNNIPLEAFHTTETLIAYISQGQSGGSKKLLSRKKRKPRKSKKSNKPRKSHKSRVKLRKKTRKSKKTRK
jgi:hypothetical protein